MSSKLKIPKNLSQSLSISIAKLFRNFYYRKNIPNFLVHHAWLFFITTLKMVSHKNGRFETQFEFIGRNFGRCFVNYQSTRQFDVHYVLRATSWTWSFCHSSLSRIIYRTNDGFYAGLILCAIDFQGRNLGNFFWIIYSFCPKSGRFMVVL
jgi:hypothetical protein